MLHEHIYFDDELFVASETESAADSNSANNT